jgi:electron transfer flavoprotein alpha subunit
MSEVQNILVFIEQSDGKVADVSLELICEGRRLSEKLGCEVEGFLAGDQIQADELAKLGHYGCQRVFLAEDPRLAHFTSIPYSEVACQVITQHKPRIVLFGATTNGRDIAPRVASKLGCGLTADCTELEIGDYKFKDKEYHNILLQNRPAFGGNILATIVSPESNPVMSTVREGVMKLDAPDLQKTVEVVKFSPDLKQDHFLTEVVEVIRQEKAVDLKKSRIIVSAGMGACNPESLALVKQLAEVLGGEVGASRPVIDSGLLPRDHQVGQTGITVRPNLYICCGISGQIQHRAGMDQSQRIIAINNDPNAPIFAVAHYGIVGDVNEVLPKMIEAYKAKE